MQPRRGANLKSASAAATISGINRQRRSRNEMEAPLIRNPEKGLT